MKWESSADKMHYVQYRVICSPCGLFKEKKKIEWKSSVFYVLMQLCGGQLFSSCRQEDFLN